MISRLTQLPTLRINPVKRLPFTYKGKKYQGVSGDTLATALYANGIRIFSRSLKSHRPRGLYSLNGECANCLVEVDGVPNVQAETTPLRGGMSVKPQSFMGNPEWNLMGFMDKMDWAMPAGFYYHGLCKQHKVWPFFQKPIRRIVRGGTIAPSFRMEGHYDEQYVNADVCIVGGGPGGIFAAMAAAGRGLRVVLLEARPWLGGFFDYRSGEYTPGVLLYTRARELAGKLEETPDIRIFRRTFVSGFHNDNHLTAFQIGSEAEAFHERHIEIRAKSVVIATGCMERPLLFDNNERPGIMQIDCVHRLARTYGLVPGERAVFSVGHDLGLEAAIDLSDMGMEIAAVADSRPDSQNPRLIDELANREISFLPGWTATRAYGAKKVEKVSLSKIEGQRGGEFECDILVASAGLTASAGPLFLCSAKMAYDTHTGFFLPKNLPPGVHAAGRMLGFHDPFSIEASGRLAGLLATKDCGAADIEPLIREAREKLDALSGPSRGAKLVKAPVTGKKTFVCFDEDVTIRHVNQACEMGFDSVELVKRFTGAGTGPGQGAISGHNLPLFISQYHTDSSITPLPSTIRPPLVPTFLATYAGSRHDMLRRTALHESLKHENAVFRRIGQWECAVCFSGDTSCRGEIENVRNNAGIMDVSRLGKFRIFGPDAAKALQRVYVGKISDISAGKAKYSAMCNEDGCLIDDGLIVKTGENDYYFTTSEERAGETSEWFRYHTRYEKWDYHMVNLTDAFAAILLAGPNARKILQKIADADISEEAFPYMGYRTFALKQNIEESLPFAGQSQTFGLEQRIPVRVLRPGFVGKFSYEIHVSASLARTAWDLLMKAGAEFDLRPFGLEARNVLRLEKGHVIANRESEIRTTLNDLGMGALWERNADMDTIGIPALRFTKHQLGRMKLVGFQMDKNEASCLTPKDGAIVVADDTIQGYVCTARYSFTLQSSIGLALVESRLAGEGNRLELFEHDMNRDERLHATVVSRPFYGEN